MVRLSFALLAAVIVVSALTGAGAALAAPALANLTADNQIQFTSGGFNAPHDINVVDQAGALRFYACPELTNPPNCAATQFFGNFANVFGGQLFLDAGATQNGAVILRTATDGQGIAERMRVASNGNVGIGTQDPRSALHVSGNYIQLPTRTNDPPPATDCDEAAEVGRTVIYVFLMQGNWRTALLYCGRFGVFGGPTEQYGWWTLQGTIS